MINYVKSGCVLTLTAPAGGVVSGSVYLIGGIFVVATSTVAATLPFEGATDGVFTLTKVTAETWVEGQAVFWDVANSRASTDPTAGLPIGSVGVAATSSDTTGAVRLNEVSLGGRVFVTRKRFTIAQVNAGATIVPAMPGMKIRMDRCTAIAIGGAAGAVTTVDVIGTLTTARKLVAFAQASLTQSTQLTAGNAGSAILADGASFTANDAGTAVTIGKTGADVTTATHIDISLTYSIE